MIIVSSGNNNPFELTKLKLSRNNNRLVSYDRGLPVLAIQLVAGLAMLAQPHQLAIDISSLVHKHKQLL